MNNDHLHTLLSTKNKIHNTQKGHFLKYFYLESVLTFAKLFSLSTSSTNEYIVIFQHISICHLQQICNKLLFFCCLQTPKRPFYKASRTPYLSRLFIVGISFNVCLSLCVFCRNHNKIKACRLFYVDFAFVLFCLLFLIHGKNYGKKATQTFLLEWLILLTIQF